MKLMIDIDEKRYEEIKQIAKAQFELTDKTEAQIIANGTLFLTEGDLISRSELKKALCEFMKNNIGIYSNEMFHLVDSIPTVDSVVNTVAVRPQGTWIKWNFKTFGAMGDWEYKCSNCEKVYDGEYNFCPNCGADMRKDGAE